MNLPLEDWKQKASNAGAIVIDLRTSVEREEGFIKDSIHLDFYDAPNFMAKLKEMNPQKEYCIYCHSGVRGSQAAIVFKNEGFTKVYNLEGGYKLYCEHLE